MESIDETHSGEAKESESSPVTHEHKAGNRHNRVFVIGSDGLALTPCSSQRARRAKVAAGQRRVLTHQT